MAFDTFQKSWVTGAAILGAFIGAMVFGRIADRRGRKSVYVTVAVVMIVGALLSCFSPGFAGLSPPVSSSGSGSVVTTLCRPC